MAWLRFVIIGALGLVLSLLDDWPAITLISTAVLVLTGVLFVWSRFALRGLSFSRVIPTRTTVGDQVTERVLLGNRSLIGKLFVEIDDGTTLPGHVANRVVSMGPRTVRSWTVTSVVKQRGAHSIGPVTLRSADPLGFFRRELRATGTLDIIAYPLLLDLPLYSPASLLQSGGGTIHRRSQVPTAAVGGVRDYTTGDSINVISWTSTARAGRLMVKEFEVDPTSDVWIVLDVGQNSASADGARYSSENPMDWLANDLEYRIMLAASLTRRVLELGRSVGLLSNTNGMILLPPERSDRQFVRIQEYLAVINGEQSMPLAELVISVSPRFRPNTSLLVLTSVEDSNLIGALASLRRRRISTEIFLVDSMDVGLEHRSLFADQLVGAGISCRHFTRFDHPSDVLGQATASRIHPRQTA